MTDQNKKPIAIIAGNGRLPIEAAEMLQAKGKHVFLIGIAGEATDDISRFEHMVMEWGQVGRLFKALKRVDAGSILLAGGIVRRPDINLRKFDWGTFRTLPEILGVLLSGDNAILSGVIDIFQKRGFAVASFPELLPELMVHSHTNSGKKPRAADIERLWHGAAVVQALGPFDIGQGAVILGDRAVAVEGVEGTDAMLDRVAQLRTIGRLPVKRGGVLVKCLKPDQDQRADLPTIGPETIRNLHAAGLNGIGVEAERTIIVEREKTVELARELGVFIYGLDVAKGQSNG